jgi:transmembrane sensor
MPWADWNTDLRTEVGERRQTTLADGTQLWINTDTAVAADYGAAFRRIVLHDGEVLVESAADLHSPPRPLVVDTMHGRARAIGTRFSVWNRQDDTCVAVFAGAVEISPANGGMSLRLAAGQQCRFDRSGVAAVHPADPNREAWSRGMLLADNMRLADFLAELGRHRRGHLGCDPAVAELRLVGAYPLVDTDRVFAALEDTLPVRRYSPLPWWTTIESVGGR